MDWIKSKLAYQQNPGEGTSLLSDWKSYESGAQDVEVGGTLRPVEATTSTTRVQAMKVQVDGASARVVGFLTNSMTSIKTSVSTLPASLPTALPAMPTLETFSIPTGQQLVIFFSCLAAGAFFLMLSFFVFLPVIIITPSKFALSFTLGCLAIMGGFTVLKGWKQQLTHMMQAERLPFSAAYIGSVVATLYSALILKSYLFSLICSGLQFVALLYYTMSYFPGGTAGVKFMLGMFTKAVYSCFGSVQSALLK